jgi:hypothetical protein
MSLVESLLDIARREVGVEEAGGNNLGPRIDEYRAATWLEPGPWPWCAAFTSWVLREALRTHAGRVFLNGHDAHQWRCRSAAAFEWIAWARHRGLQVIDPSNGNPAAGDFVVYEFSHIGIVELPMLVAGEPRVQQMITIEGNTALKGLRDSDAGDGVWRLRRAVSLARAYIRLPVQLPTR